MPDWRMLFPAFDNTKKAQENALNFSLNSMRATYSIYASTTVSMTDLRRNPSGILEDAGDLPVAVLNHNKPTAYLLSAKAYETLLERLDDAELARVVKQRRDGKRVKVKLEDL